MFFEKYLVKVLIPAYHSLPVLVFQTHFLSNFGGLHETQTTFFNSYLHLFCHLPASISGMDKRFH